MVAAAGPRKHRAKGSLATLRPMRSVSADRGPAIAPELEQLAINTIRTLSIDAVQKANSGHPGLPLGAAPMAYALWQQHYKHDPKDPTWFDRDRFVLSAGHGSMLLYSLLHLTGYDVSLDDLKQFRQWGSKTPGHSVRAPRTPSAWRSPSATSGATSIARATRSSITTRTRSSPTATSWRAS